MLSGGSSYLNSVATTFKSVINIVLPAFIGLAIIGFAYGIFIYVRGGAEKKEEGKNIIVWGGLAVVVLLSIYGIAGLLQNIFGADGTIVAVPKTYKGSGGSGYITEENIQYEPEPGETVDSIIDDIENFFENQ